MNLGRWILAVAAICFSWGCEREETYKGKPMSEWIALSKDRDTGTRLAAIDALLASAAPTPAVEARVTECLSDPSPAVRIYVAGRIWVLRQDEAEASLVKWLDAENSPGIYMRDLVAALQHRHNIGPLIPAMDRAIARCDSPMEKKTIKEARDALAAKN